MGDGSTLRLGGGLSAWEKVLLLLLLLLRSTSPRGVGRPRQVSYTLVNRALTSEWTSFDIDFGSGWARVHPSRHRPSVWNLMHKCFLTPSAFAKVGQPRRFSDLGRK